MTYTQNLEARKARLNRAFRRADDASRVTAIRKAYWRLWDLQHSTAGRSTSAATYAGRDAA